MEKAAIPSHGSTINGMWYVAAGRGPHPVLLLLHGLPGFEENLDIAQAVRRVGWDVLTIHYRGSWGSPGTFSFSHAIEDGPAALAYIRDPDVSKRFRADPRRIVILGHSMGGAVAAHAAAYDPAVLALALVSAWDINSSALLLKSDEDRLKALQQTRLNMQALAGCTAEQLISEELTHGAEWSLANQAAGIGRRPLLLVTAAEGMAFQTEALEIASHRLGNPTITAVHFGTDHSYSDCRIALTTAVIRWLAQLKTSPEARK
jgi:pimeloyl-ACP methyl ester carboxylesterase